MADNETKIKIANNRLVTTERRYWTASAVALLIVWMVWPYISTVSALAAGAGLVLACHIMSVITWLYHRDETRDARPDFWENWLVIGNLAAGTIGGMITASLYLELPADVTPRLILFATLLIGAWSTANIPSMKCVYAFFLTAIAPIMIAIMVQGSPSDYAHGAIILLFFLSLVKHARLVSGTYRASAEQVSGLQHLADIEAQLRELISDAYARQRELLEAVPVSVIVSRREGGELLFANSAALELLGLKSLAERPGVRGADFFVNPGERDTIVHNFNAKEGVVAVEFQLKRGDGTNFWAFYTAVDMTYADQDAIIGTITDITSRREAEEALRKSEEKFRLLADHAHDLISIYSMEGVSIYVSPSIERTLGYQQDEFIGQPLSNFVHPEDMKEIYSANAKSMHEETIAPLYTFRIRHKAGHWEWMEGSSTVERDKNTGKFTQVSSVSRLVTERVRHEQELREARERAEAADRAKSDFLAHMSHEIRTPLNAVIGFSEVMRDELFGPLGSARYLDYSNDIYNSGVHLLALINEVLDLSKIEAGKFELQEDQVPLDAIIDSTFRFLHERADSKLIALQSRLHASPVLWCDRRVLTQVMLNVVGNAIKFTPERGRITVESILDDGGNLVLMVTDTGIGIAQEDIPIVMKPFGQARASSHIAVAEPGTGLGLPLAKSFIEKHDGTFSITSELGIGTRVTMTIPASRVMNDKEHLVSAAF
jgi:PAS domain S-box-containing protein